MSIKTLSKKMLAIVAAGAMTMGLAMPTSVFAAEGDTATKVTEAYISKTFNTEVGKDETFFFYSNTEYGRYRFGRNSSQCYHSRHFIYYGSDWNNKTESKSKFPCIYRSR